MKSHTVPGKVAQLQLPRQVRTPHADDVLEVDLIAEPVRVAAKLGDQAKDRHDIAGDMRPKPPEAGEIEMTALRAVPPRQTKIGNALALAAAAPWRR